MAHLVLLSDGIQATIARQVEDFIRVGALTLKKGKRAALAESFQVWHLTPEHAYSVEPLAAIEPTGLWHHQILEDDVPVGYARSRADGPRDSDWRVTQVFQSPLAAAIDAAITVVDKADLPGEARLLVAPSWQLTALWMVNEGHKGTFVIAHTPLVEAGRHSVFEAGDFVDWVRALPIIQGRAY